MREPSLISLEVAMLILSKFANLGFPPGCDLGAHRQITLVLNGVMINFYHNCFYAQSQQWCVVIANYHYPKKKLCFLGHLYLHGGVSDVMIDDLC